MFLNVDKSDEQITADILTEVPSKYQKSVGFFAWDYARAIAIGGLRKVYEKLKYICKMGDIPILRAALQTEVQSASMKIVCLAQIL